MLALGIAINNHIPDHRRSTTAPKDHFSRQREQIRSFGSGFLQWMWIDQAPFLFRSFNLPFSMVCL
jgi:hypothetical protein